MSETYNSTAIAKADGTVEEIANNEKVLNDLDPLYAKTNELDHNLVSKVLTGTKPTTAIESGEFFKDKDGNFRVANQAISTSTDVSDSNSTIKTAGEVLRELNSKTTIKNVTSEVTANVSFTYLYVLEIGRIIFICFLTQQSGMSSGTLLCTLPNEYKPIYGKVTGVCANEGDDTMQMIEIATSDGGMRYYGNTATYVAGSVMYVR